MQDPGEPAGGKATRIAHISDLHFGRTDPAAVEALRARIQRDPPDLIAVSGDLTQGARNWEFAEARSFLDSLGSPWIAVPGNHDITPYRLLERMFDPWRRWNRHIGLEIEPTWSDGRVSVVGLNTARRGGLSWNWAHGRVRRYQLGALSKRLDACPAGAVRIVMAHHPMVAPEDDPLAPVAGRGPETLALLARHGVALVLCGHLHRPFDRMHAGPGSVRVIGVPTSTSTRLRNAPNGWNLITVRQGEALVEPQHWDGTAWAVTLGVSPAADPARPEGRLPAG